MLEKIKKKLRGKHNSLKLRYIVLPRDYAIEFLFHIFGRKWIDFYKYRMDRAAHYAAASKKEIPEVYIKGGELQAEFLMKQGLNSSHKLLDFGCGILRLRAAFEPYDINYYGVDISGERLVQGIEMLKKRGINPDTSKFVEVSDYEMTALKETDFDYVWAASVYTHVPVDEIIYSMKCIRERLKPTGKFIFTFSPAPGNEVVRANQKDWYQPKNVIEDCARKAGFDVTVQEKWEDTGKGGMVAILTLPGAAAAPPAQA